MTERTMIQFPSPGPDVILSFSTNAQMPLPDPRAAAQAARFASHRGHYRVAQTLMGLAAALEEAHSVEAVLAGAEGSWDARTAQVPLLRVPMRDEAARADAPPHPTCVESTSHVDIVAGRRAWICSGECPPAPPHVEAPCFAVNGRCVTLGHQNHPVVHAVPPRDVEGEPRTSEPDSPLFTSSRVFSGTSGAGVTATRLEDPRDASHAPTKCGVCTELIRWAIEPMPIGDGSYVPGRSAWEHLDASREHDHQAMPAAH